MASPAPMAAPAAMVTFPTAALLTAIWLILLRHLRPRIRTLLPFGVAVPLVLASTLTPVPEIAAGLVCLALLVVVVTTGGPALRRAAVDSPQES
jgi:hypothetical protein